MLTELIILYYALGTALVLSLLAIAYALGRIAHALGKLATEMQKLQLGHKSVNGHGNPDNNNAR